MSDIQTRAAKLLDQLGAWFDADEVKPPPYVQREIDELREVLSQWQRCSECVAPEKCVANRRCGFSEGA